MTDEIIADGALVATESGTTSRWPLPPTRLAAMLRDAGFAEVSLLDRSGNPTAPEDVTEYTAVGRSRH